MRPLFCAALFIFAILHNIVHELGHIIFAKKLGIMVKKVDWFTASKLGGSKVYYKDEPDINDDIVEKKWGIVALGGFFTTLVIGYIIMFMYYILENINSPVFTVIICAGSMIFLMSDLIYFILGCILNFGDIIGVMKTFKVKKTIVLFILVFLLFINISIIKFMWY